MNILDDQELGMVNIPAITDMTQEELNSILLFEHDRKDLFNSLDKRVGKENLDFLLEGIDKNDLTYWKAILLKLAKIYNLNYCKEYVFGNTSTKPFVDEVINFLKFIKIDLIYAIEHGIIKKDITYDEFKTFLNGIKNIPEIFELCIKYMEAGLFQKFMNIVVNESKQDFSL